MKKVGIGIPNLIKLYADSHFFLFCMNSAVGQKEEKRVNFPPFTAAARLHIGCTTLPTMTPFLGVIRQRCLRSVHPWSSGRLNPVGTGFHGLHRSSSSAATQEDVAIDPGKMVSGLTKEQVDANPEIAEFLRANFGSNQNDGAATSGISVPVEILKEFGVEEEDVFEEMEGVVASSAKRYGDPRLDAGMGTPEQQSLNIRVLRSFVRTGEGSKPSQWLRENRKMIPGVLYGSDPTKEILSLTPSSKTLLKTPWAELQRELDRYHRRFESRVYDLTVYEDESDTEGTVHRVLPQNVQRHPVQGKIYCANFVRYHPGRPIKIPLTYINKEESPALKRDGYIVPVKKHVECFVAEGVPIPDSLEVECTGLKLKDIIRMDRVIFPDGVKVTDRVDVESFLVGPVKGGRGAGMAGDAEEGDDK